MSQLSEKARARAKSKVERLIKPNSGSIDASGWKEPLGVDGGVQTGPRPISRRQFKRGGKVEGEKTSLRSDRKPRKAFGGSSGAPISSSMNPSKKAQQIAESSMKMTSKRGTDPYNSQPDQAKNYQKLWNLSGGRAPRKSGGALTANSLINRDVKEANEERSGTKHIGGMKRGGRAHKDMGGLALPAWSDAVTRKTGGKVHKDEAQDRALIHKMGCACAKCHGGKVAKKDGGSIGGTRPAGGRIPRKSGGRAKKGMNVNIIIAPSGGGQKPPMPMPPPGAPGPVGLHQAPPPQMPPGASPPMGAPPMSPGGMPMARKSGGRAYPIKDGSGGGKGRLEKIRAYG